MATFSDDFNRANNADLGANWDGGYTGQGNLKVVSNTARVSTTGGDRVESYNGGTIGNNQYAKVILSTFTGGDNDKGGVVLRAASPPTTTFYMAFGTAGGATDLSYYLNGDWFSLTFGTTTWNAGDEVKGHAAGSTIELYQNGTLKLSATNDAIPAGRPGIFAQAVSESNVVLDTYEAGDLPYPMVAWRDTWVQADTTNRTAHAVTWDAGTPTAGQLLLLVFSADGNPTCSINTTNFPGWVKLNQASYSTTVTGAIFYKVSTGGETGVTVDTTVIEQVSAAIICINKGGTPTGTSATGSTTNSNPPSYNAGSSAEYLWIVTRSGDSTIVATAAPDDFGNLQSQAAAGTGGASTNTAERSWAGQTLDPATFTSALEQWVCWTIAVPYDAGSTILTPNAVVIPVAVPQPTVSLGALTLTPNAVAALLAVPSPTLTHLLTLTPSAVGVPLVIPSPSVVLGQLNLLPGPVAVPLVVPAATISMSGGPITLTPNPVGVALAVPTPTLALTLSLTPSPVAVPLVVPSPTVGLGTLTLTPGPALVPLVVPGVNVQLGTLTLTPDPASVLLSLPVPSLILQGAPLILSPGPVAVPLIIPTPTIIVAQLAGVFRPIFRPRRR